MPSWVVSGLPLVVAGAGGVLVAPAPGGPVQQMADIAGGLDDHSGGQVGDLVAGQRDQPRWWRLGVFGQRSHGEEGQGELQTRSNRPSPLWRLAERHRVRYFGTSAPFIQSCLKAGLRPRDECDLSALRAVGSTGSPLSQEGLWWLADAVGQQVQICSISGGTDLCTAFLCAAPTVPVWLGEISCAALGAAAAAYGTGGQKVVDEVGELVLTRPMPSMPVAFWYDPDGTWLREAYFGTYPGVWRHGDWVRVTQRGSYVIYGRSDSTLNRGGVRMGTADFYAVVEGFDQVADSLVIDTTELGAHDEGQLLCFLVLALGVTLTDIEPQLRRALRSELSPRHVPDRFIVIDAVPAR